MRNTTVDMWKILWPNGISVGQYERAFKILGFVEKFRPPRAIQIKHKKFKPKLVPDIDYLTPTQASKALGVSKDVIYWAVKKGHMSATRKNNSPRSGLMISKESFEQYKKKL